MKKIKLADRIVIYGAGRIGKKLLKDFDFFNISIRGEASVQKTGRIYICWHLTQNPLSADKMIRH